MRLVAVLLLVTACGGSSATRTTPQDPKKAASEARRKEIEAMEPKAPYETVDTLAFSPGERCGQGPYRIETDALGAKFGERLIVYACGRRGISGNLRITEQRTDGRRDVDESHFGWERNNAACKNANAATVAAAVSGGGGGGGGGDGTAGTSGATATSAAPALVNAVTLKHGALVPTVCDERTHMLDQGWLSTKDGTGIQGHLVLDIWSDEPNDFEDLVFVIERKAVVADMTLDRWVAYQKAHDEWVKLYRAHIDGEISAGYVTQLDSTVKTPPPPPPKAETPTPRPSQNARWIPGYWLYANTTFHWITGLWDVPPSDVEQELTVVAPKPPPAEPIRVEPPREPQPTTTAVWTDGSWQWDGRAWIWIAGAWRIPPDAQSTWQKPTWNVSAKGAILVPGGWRVRVRLR